MTDQEKDARIAALIKERDSLLNAIFNAFGTLPGVSSEELVKAKGERLAELQSERNALRANLEVSESATKDWREIAQNLEAKLEAALKDDARAGMIEVSELDPVIDLLESVAELAPDFLDDEDGHFSKETQPILDRLKALRNEHTS